MTPLRAHAFRSLVLQVVQPDILGMATFQSFELRAEAHGAGAEVWRASGISGGELADVRPEPMYVGRLGSRLVVELLSDLERSGLYETALAEPCDDPTMARVTLRLGGPEGSHAILSDAPAEEELVASVVRAIHTAVGIAQERSLAAAG